MNGKGDKPRPTDLGRYRRNYDAIRWSDKRLPVKYYDGQPGHYLGTCGVCKGSFIGCKFDFLCPACTDHAFRMEQS